MQSERRLLEKRITQLFAEVPNVEDDDLRAELTKHLCVLSSGLLEVTCRDVLSKYSRRRCSSEISRFVTSNLADFQNPRVQKIFELLAEFDPDKATRWLNNLTDEEVAGLDSIVVNRHQIAHGRSIGLSFNLLQKYYTGATNALISLESEFPPN